MVLLDLRMHVCTAAILAQPLLVEVLEGHKVDLLAFHLLLLGQFLETGSSLDHAA